VNWKKPLSQAPWNPGQAVTASFLTGHYNNDQLVKVPTMKTLIEEFREQLNIPLPEGRKEDPKVTDLLEHLATAFTKAISDPKLVGDFHALWERVKTAPRSPEGHFQLTKEVVSDVTMDKLKKW
jgi:hypothetical protein